MIITLNFSSFNKEPYILLLGDLPGTTYKTTKILATGGTHAIILYSKEKTSKKDEWIKFFNDLNIPIIVILESNLSGEQQIEEKDEMIFGKLSNLIREQPPPADSENMIKLVEKIGIKFKEDLLMSS